MMIDPALLSAMSAIAGTIVGGFASVSTAVFAQRHQDRLQRVTREVTKRETVYSEFIEIGTKADISARLNEFALTKDTEQLIVLVNRIRLFASSSVIKAADEVVMRVVKNSLDPSVDARDLATLASVKRDDYPLLAFSIACRDDLDLLTRH